MVLDRSEMDAERDDDLHALQLDCPIVETERLLMRPPHPDDAEDMARLANNYNVARMLATLPHPYFAEDAQEFIEKVRKAAANGCIYAISESATGRFIGTCGLHLDRVRYDLPFLGYWLGEPFWGKGYATESARAMVDLFFKVTANDALLASCRTDNHASRRVIEKCGGRYWKSGTAYNKALGELHYLDHFRINRESWMEATSRR